MLKIAVLDNITVAWRPLSTPANIRLTLYRQKIESLGCTMSEIRQLIGWKSFPTPLSFNALARGELFRISSDELFVAKTRDLWLSLVKISWS